MNIYAFLNKSVINGSSISDVENSIRMMKECNFIIEKNRSKNLLNHTEENCLLEGNVCLSHPIYSFPAIYIVLSTKRKVFYLWNG